MENLSVRISAHLIRKEPIMAPNVIVSYDDSLNDHDALALGRLFHELGSKVTLAYVRHAALSRAADEQLAEHEAAALLERGAAWLDDPYVERRIVMSPSTGEGLARLATEVGAGIVVFGSDYRTAKGRISIGRSADVLLENGPAAVALAPAGFAAASRELATVGILPGTTDAAAVETAHSLAARHNAATRTVGRGVDLLVVGSRPEAREGRVMISSSARNAVEEASSPVLITARGVALAFETLVTA